MCKQVLLAVVALLLSVVRAPAAAPGGVEIACDVVTGEFLSAANGQTEVTFRAWNTEVGATQIGSDYLVPMTEFLAFNERSIRFDSVRAHGFVRLMTVLGDDVAPFELGPGSEVWIDLTIGARLFSCDASTVPPRQRRRLQSVAFAVSGSGSAGGLPAGTIVLSDAASCPEGFGRVTDCDGRFLVGAASAASTGGANSHDHGGQSASASGGNIRFDDNSGGTDFDEPAHRGHTHGIAAADSRPEFRTILLCRKD